jgi:hypothetical protein
MTALSTHFHAFCAVETAVTRAADSLEASLRRFGPVKRGYCEGFDEALGWLLPLTSFPSRYLLVPCSGWTVILHNGRSAAADDQLLSVSKAAACRGTYGSWAAEGCIWQLVQEGRERRSVACYLDGDRWVFHQQGAPFPFENQVLYEKRRKKDRLAPEVVQEYLGQLIDVPFPPDWRSLMSQEAVCLERSTDEVRVPIQEYTVEVDL